MTDYDAIIIGAGHNGLICGSYLAKAGQRVLILDARDQAGGCASTREVAPGFRMSDCAQWLYQLDDAIVRDLGLEAAGLKEYRRRLSAWCRYWNQRPGRFSGFS